MNSAFLFTRTGSSFFFFCLRSYHCAFFFFFCSACLRNKLMKVTAARTGNTRVTKPIARDWSLRRSEQKLCHPTPQLY